MKYIIYKFYKNILGKYYALMFKPKVYYSSKVEFLFSKSEIKSKTIENAKTLDVKGIEIYKYMNASLLEEASFEMRGVWVAKINKGTILINLRNAVAIIDEFGKLIEGLTFTYELNKANKYYHAPVNQNYFLNANEISKPKRVKGSVFSLLTGGGKNFNFYHWFLDSLSRLGDLELAGWTNDIDFIWFQNMFTNSKRNYQI